jgi:hypothetical protein
MIDRIRSALRHRAIMLAAMVIVALAVALLLGRPGG